MDDLEHKQMLEREQAVVDRLNKKLGKINTEAFESEGWKSTEIKYPSKGLVDIIHVNGHRAYSQKAEDVNWSVIGWWRRSDTTVKPVAEIKATFSNEPVPEKIKAKVDDGVPVGWSWNNDKTTAPYTHFKQAGWDDEQLKIHGYLVADLPDIKSPVDLPDPSANVVSASGTVVDPNSRYYDAGGIETIDVIKAKLTPEQLQGYLLGNIIKYSCRLNFKGSAQRDAEKLKFYSQWLSETNE